MLRTTNVSHVDYTLDAVDEHAVVGAYDGPFPQRPPDGVRVAGGALDLQPERNVPSLTSIDLGELAPGYYRLRVEPAEASARVQDHLLVVTRTMLAVKESGDRMLVWATDLRTGIALANVGVRVLRPGTAERIAVGNTAADGTLQVDLPATKIAGPVSLTRGRASRPAASSSSCTASRC